LHFLKLHGRPGVKQ